jgi:hypothetical protein
LTVALSRKRRITQAAKIHMTIGFLNLAILAGMAALVIPPIIHFLNRRRHDVVDWGAMQFLHINPAKKRRLFIEELLLMALRMGLIALLVAAFAAPYVAGPLAAGWTRTPRDIALVVDTSASMALRHGGKETPWQEARAWIEEWLETLDPQDRVIVALAGQPPQLLSREPSADRAWLRQQLDGLTEPAGGGDGPRAVQDAYKLLRLLESGRPREIVILSDRQRFGWTDAGGLLQWRQLKDALAADRALAAEDPRIVVPSLTWRRFGDAEAMRSAPNYRLAPLEAARTLVGAGQKLRFGTALHGERLPNHMPPRALQLFLNNEPVRDLPVPTEIDFKSGQAPLTFDHRFDVPGVHLVSVKLDVDAKRDALPADNEQHLAVEVVQDAAIVLVDGADDLAEHGATYFLAKAFADPADKAKVSFIFPRRTTATAFDAEAMLLPATPRPRAVVLADVPRLSDAQREALATFVREGGGLLVVLGPRVDAAHYNADLWRGGDGWLPARLDSVVQAPPGDGAALDVRRSVHPALTLFRDEPHCTLGNAAYTRWWRVIAEHHSRAAVGAMLTNGAPWLVERSFGEGRVLVSTLPMDRSWDGHLPKTWEFPVLAHELVYSLAEIGGGDFNLAPGQSLRIDPSRWTAAPPVAARCTLHGPGKQARSKVAVTWPLLWDNSGPSGIYRLDIEGGPSVPVVVRPDARESDLTPQAEDDLTPLREWVRIDEGDGAGAQAAVADIQTHEVWWLFLVGVIGLLCTELWLTRRMALARGRT